MQSQLVSGAQYDAIFLTELSDLGILVIDLGGLCKRRMLSILSRLYLSDCMVEQEKHQLDAERAHEQLSLDPQTALDALQLQVAIEHGGITGVKPEIIGAPKEWTARFNGKEINILYTPASGRPYFLLKQPIDVAKLIFSADNKAILDLKIPTTEGEKRFTCVMSKDANDLASLEVKPFENLFPETIELGGAFAGQQTKRWGDAVMISPDGSDEIASFVVDRTKLTFPGDTLTLPQVVSTNGAHLGVYKVKITRMRDKLVVTAEKLATEKIEKTQLTEKIAGAPDTWKLTRNGKEFRILVAEPGKRSYFVNAGRPVASAEINTFDARVVKIFTHAGETYQIVFSNSLGAISAEMKKDDLDKKILQAGKTITETYANKKITISNDDITKTIDLVPLHEQLLQYGKADAGSLQLESGTWNDIVVTMQGDILQLEYTEVTKGIRGANEKVELNIDLTEEGIDVERIQYWTTKRENNTLYIFDAKHEVIWKSNAIDPTMEFSGTAQVGVGTESLENQRIEGRLWTVFVTNEQGTLNVDVIPGLPNIKLVEIAEPKDDRKVTVQKEAYTITLEHPKQGAVVLDLTKLPWSAMSLENGHAQGHIVTKGTDGTPGGIFALDLCNTNGVVTIQCLPYHAETTPGSKKKTNQINTKEFQQQGDIKTIYDETPPFRGDTEIGQYQSSVMTIDGGAKIDRLYVDYDTDTNNFSIYFVDKLLGKDSLNPDEQLLLLDLKLHQDKGKRFYTDALWGARWEIDVTVDAKRVLRVRVVPPKNLGQLIERRKQQQGPKIDRSFPELGDAFKRIKTPEQLKQARELLKKLIEGIGTIEDLPTDLVDVGGKNINVGSEILTHIDKKVYPLGNVDVDLLKDMYVTPLQGSTIDIMQDTWGPINDSLCKVDLKTLQPDTVYNMPGDDGTWKVKVIVDMKVVGNTTRKILRVAVTPPQAWIDKQNPTHTDVVETPGRPFARPLDNLHAHITGDFGELRKSSKGWRRHQGIDIDVPNTPSTYPPAKASYDGKVKLIGYDGNGYGNYIVLEHRVGNKQYLTLYGHLSKVTVREDQIIKRGDKIGATGNSGSSSGAHLHFEVRMYDPKYKIEFLKSRRPIDPLHVTNRSRTTPTPSPRPAPAPAPAPRPAPQPAPNNVPPISKIDIPQSEKFNEENTPFILLPDAEKRSVTFKGTPVPIERYVKALEPIGGGLSKIPRTRRLWRSDGKASLMDTTTNKKLITFDVQQFDLSVPSGKQLIGTSKAPLAIGGKQRNVQFSVDLQGILGFKLSPAQ